MRSSSWAWAADDGQLSDLRGRLTELVWKKLTVGAYALANLPTIERRFGYQHREQFCSRDSLARRDRKAEQRLQSIVYGLWPLHGRRALL